MDVWEEKSPNEMINDSALDTDQETKGLFALSKLANPGGCLAAD